MKKIIIATISSATILFTMGSAEAWYYGPWGYNGWYYGYQPEYYYVPNVIIDNSITAGRDVYINTPRKAPRAVPRCQRRTICESGDCRVAEICP